jgi:hypothetical protein
MSSDTLVEPSNDEQSQWPIATSNADQSSIYSRPIVNRGSSKCQKLPENESILPERVKRWRKEREAFVRGLENSDA